MSNLKIQNAHVRAVESGHTWLKLLAPAGNPVAILMLRDVKPATK